MRSDRRSALAINAQHGKKETKYQDQDGLGIDITAKETRNKTRKTNKKGTYQHPGPSLSNRARQIGDSHTQGANRKDKTLFCVIMPCKKDTGQHDADHQPHRVSNIPSGYK